MSGEFIGVNPGTVMAESIEITRSSILSRPSWIFHFLRGILFYGRAICVLPFSIVKDNNGDYFLKSGGIRKGLFIFVQIIIISHIWYRFLRLGDKTDDINIMKWIWKFTFELSIIYDIVIIYYCGWKGNNIIWIEIMKQFDKVESRFMDLSVNIWSSSDSIFGFGLPFIHFLFGFVHIMTLRNIKEYDGTKLNDDDGLTLIPFTVVPLDSLSLETEWVKPILSIAIAIPDIFVWGIWHYGDALKLTAAFIIRKLYKSLNEYLENGDAEEIKRNLEKIIQVHQSITELLFLLNKLLAPLTFLAVPFWIGYISYYGNFILFGFGGTLRRICFANFAVRTAVTMWITADVNTKAHAMKSWLGRLSAESDGFPQCDSKKFAIFTSQLYNEHIGFKGLDFFTISTSFIGKVVGILFSYTVILVQFSGKQPFQ